jgi:hypothetical protein
MKSYELPQNGYEVFGDTDSGGGYDWSIFRVWLKDGVFYWASDSGCSCNGPFDGHTFPDDFEGHGTAHEALKALAKYRDANSYSAGSIEPLLVKLMDYSPEAVKA